MKKSTPTFRSLAVLWGIFVLLGTVQPLRSQNIIGGETGNSSAILDLQSEDKGLLIPRMTASQRSAITNPAPGLMIFNTTFNCLEINLGSSSNPDWLCMVSGGKLASLDCGTANNTGSLTAGTAATGVSSSVPYTGGNGGFYAGQTVSSTGVTGLTATLVSGTLASGSGNLTYTITGTPSGSGTASFALGAGGQSCTLSLTVAPLPGVISSLNCASATNTGSLVPSVAASGVSSSVPYTGGNGGTHTGQTVTSTGVTGLTATLTAGSFASGSGSVVYTITGTPSGAGTASFALSIGGQSCTLQLTVVACGAFVASGVWKDFMCHNLGANTSADPLVPSWELTGNYYQWGRNPTCFARDGVDGSNPCSSPVYGAAGPWGSTTANDNAGAITGWSTTAAANGAWADGSKTASDPCPPGFKVPSSAQWTAVVNANLNSRTNIGSWSDSSTNYSSGILIGSSLFLPAAGFRESSNGSLTARGIYGVYWSSTQSGGNALGLLFLSGSGFMNEGNRVSAYPVRCVAQ